jgi:hypothetical protein
VRELPADSASPMLISLVIFLFSDKKVTRILLCLIFYPQGLLNVERKTVEKSKGKFSSQSLLKSYDFHTPACGEISVAALRKNPLFHINFP